MIEFWTVSERTGLKQTEDNQGGNWLTKVQLENGHENGVHVFYRFSPALASYFPRLPKNLWRRTEWHYSNAQPTVLKH